MAYCGSSEVAICLEDADSDVISVDVWAANISSWDWDDWFSGSDPVFTWTPDGDQCGCFDADVDDTLYVNGDADGTSIPWLVYGPNDEDDYADVVVYGGNQVCANGDNGSSGGNSICES